MIFLSWKSYCTRVWNFVTFWLYDQKLQHTTSVLAPELRGEQVEITPPKAFGVSRKTVLL